MKKLRSKSSVARLQFEPRLRAYSTSAAAVFVATAAAGTTAVAEAQTISLIHTPSESSVSIPSATGSNAQENFNPLPVGGPYHYLELGHGWNLLPGLLQSNHAFGGTTRAKGHALVYPGGSRIYLGRNNGGAAVVNLPFGAPIAANNFGRGYPVLFATSAVGTFPGAYGHQIAGQFNANQTGYLGFKAKDNGNTYYGWLRVRVGTDGNGRPTSIALIPGAGDVVGAYGLVGAFGGQNLGAGQVTAIPELASVATGLALFALGAAGVREHRRRRRLAA